MKTEIFLILINIILIYSNNKIIKHDSVVNYKNFRKLDDLSDKITNIIPSDMNDSPPNPPSGLPLIPNSDITDLPSGSIPEPPTRPNRRLLLIVDSYNYNATNGSLTFLAKFWYENKNDVQENVTFTINKTAANRLRFLQNDNQITCLLNRSKSNDDDQIYVYECRHDNYNESFAIIYEGNSTEFAQYLLEHIKEQTKEIASSNGFIIMNDCLIENPKINVINGKPTQNITDNSKGHLYLNGNRTQPIPITLTKKNETNYEISLNTNNEIKGSLSNKMGEINSNGANKTLLLIFKEGSNSTLDYDGSNSTEIDPATPSNHSLNKAYIPKKSSGGLSAGAIVAIILPCIAALLAVLGLAFFLGKSSSGAVAKTTIPMENINMGNNTIGISSSTNVVNKYP